MLVFTAKNDTDVSVNEYKIEVEFPLTFLNLSTFFGAEVRERRTETHVLFRHTQEAHGYRILDSGDSRDILSVEYFVGDSHSNNGATQLPIRIRFNADNFSRQVKQTSIYEILNQSSSPIIL